MAKQSEIQFLIEEMNKTLVKESETSLREKLSELEHNQWCEWSKNLSKTETIDAERLERWKKLWKPYSELTEEEKDQDRVYADRVLATLKAQDILKENSLPDGSSFFTASFPLPKDHWLYKEHDNEPPGVDPEGSISRDAIIKAAEFAIRAATSNGKILDFDPDAMVQNFVLGFHKSYK